jgi:hypothetical protein
MCPARVRAVTGMHSDLETYGSKVVWILAWDGSSAEPTNAMAQEYYEGQGVDFGWYTDDRDNSLGFCEFLASPMISGVPWVGIIDADTMELVADNPADIGSLITSLGAS